MLSEPTSTKFSFSILILGKENSDRHIKGLLMSRFTRFLRVNFWCHKNCWCKKYDKYHVWPATWSLQSLWSGQPASRLDVAAQQQQAPKWLFWGLGLVLWTVFKIPTCWYFELFNRTLNIGILKSSRLLTIVKVYQSIQKQYTSSFQNSQEQ